MVAHPARLGATVAERRNLEGAEEALKRGSREGAPEHVWFEVPWFSGSPDRLLTTITGSKPPADHVPITCSSAPATVSTSYSWAFANTTTTMPSCWKHRAADVNPNSRPVWPSAP